MKIFEIICVVSLSMISAYIGISVSSSFVMSLLAGMASMYMLGYFLL